MVKRDLLRSDRCWAQRVDEKNASPNEIKRENTRSYLSYAVYSIEIDDTDQRKDCLPLWLKSEPCFSRYPRRELFEGIRPLRQDRWSPFRGSRRA